jgi:ADP-heptose:LPS heptosyltransferase
MFSLNLKAFLLRLMTNKRFIDFKLEEVKSVLFFRYDRIGDMVITTPVFREFKRSFPDVKILVLASKVNKDVLQNNPYIDEIIINNKNNFFGDCISLFKLRRRKIDVCIELDHSVVPHAIIRLRIINPKKIISVRKDGRYGVSGNELSMYNFYTKKITNMHFRDIWLSTLHPFGIKPTNNSYDLFPSTCQDKVAKSFIKKYGTQFKIGINLEGAVKGKKIQDVDLEKICKGLKKSHKSIQIIIITAPENLERVVQLVKKMGLSYVSPSYKTSKILDVAALIKNLDIIITPDTSISHIASAFNKPIVSIHENNLNSYKLFTPTSSLSKTVFATEKNSLVGYDAQKVVDYTNQILWKDKHENSRN